MKSFYKHILRLLSLIIIFSCENEIVDDFRDLSSNETLPELTSGTADFSNYVALGASFTAGFTDGALFIAAQQNSFPNILANEFAKIGGGNFTQPLMSDNFGGLAFGGIRLPGLNPRLVFGGAGPVPLESLIGPVTVTTDLTSNPTGPFNNLGVPGAKSFHLLFNGYGNPTGLQATPATANPYFVRMASSPTATMLGDAMAQNPTFFTLSEIGGNDVLGYATSGGDGTNPITDTATFNFAFTTLVTTLTSGGAKGVVTNVPYITDLPHFTTVPYNPLSPDNPSFGPLIPTLNGVFGQLNQVYDFLDMPERSILFSDSDNSPVVIKDENLVNISAQITAVLNGSATFPTFIQSFGLPPAAAPLVATLFGNMYGQTRQATSEDLFVLPSSAVIGTVNTTTLAFLQSQGLPANLAGQFSVEGVTNPLADKWVLTPEEQQEIKTATDAYNNTISAVANSEENIALVDLNSILAEVASTGIDFDGFNLTSSLVTGGAVSLDGIHLNPRGYALMANKFLEAIDNKFGSNFIASGNVAKAVDYKTNFPALLQ